MKNIVLVMLLCFTTTFYSSAQQIADRSQTDCNGNTESIYQLLENNKVLLVAADGLDCSICMSHAPAISTFATANLDKIRVWGAFHFKVAPNTPSCAQIANWVNTYAWGAVFSFADTNRFWRTFGYPTYTVIDPITRTIAYRGSSHTQAMNKATELANTITNNALLFPQSHIRCSLSNKQLILNGALRLGPFALIVSDLRGKVLFHFSENTANEAYTYTLPNLANGYYIVTLTHKGGRMAQKFIIE